MELRDVAEDVVRALALNMDEKWGEKYVAEHKLEEEVKKNLACWSIGRSQAVERVVRGHIALRVAPWGLGAVMAAEDLGYTAFSLERETFHKMLAKKGAA